MPARKIRSHEYVTPSEFAPRAWRKKVQHSGRAYYVLIPRALLEGLQWGIGTLVNVRAMEKGFMVEYAGEAVRGIPAPTVG